MRSRSFIHHRSGRDRAAPLRSCVPAIGFGLAMLAAGWAMAQAGGDAERMAREVYERDLAMCNSGDLPAPRREACVRAAGNRLDRARGIAPADTVQTSPDGRASVVTPQGEPAPGSASDPVTTRDGRAVVVPNR